MSSKSQWRELIESLRDRYRLIAIDLLGYGESVMPGDSYRLRDEVHLVESVLARELPRGEPFHLIGHSYGGMVALQLAAQSPARRVRSLSLFEPIAFHLLPAGDPDLVELEAVRREIEDRLEAGDAHGGAGRFVDYWSGAGAFEQLREERQSVLAAQVPKILLESRAVGQELGHMNNTNYRRINVPTCLVTGQWSPDVAQRLTSMLSGILPHASCFEVAAGHMAPITHPALVNPVFEQFVRAVDSGERREAAARSWPGRARAAAFGLLAAAISALPLLAVQDVAQDYFAIPAEVAYLLEESAWHESPPGMPPGASFAVISGDPREEGPYVMRLRLPPGYILPPYRRSSEEQMIVLAGAITVGSAGESGSATVRTLTSGSYASLAAGDLHFAHTQHGAIVQIFGTGPFEMGG
jgi:pimeloyl-ACP methyl ester carboxylesterase